MTTRTFFRLTPAVCMALLICFALTTNSHATTTVSNISPSFGTTGAAVTIYGTNFGTSTGTVKFNGVSATVGTWSATKITVTVPATATTGLVAVGVFHGSSVNSTQDFNVLPTKGSLVLGAFPPTGTTCSGIGDYNGTNCVGDYRTDVIPSIDGVMVSVQWSSIENSSGGTYTWTTLDNAVNTFVGQTNWSAAKKVGIVLSPVTNGSSNTSTPAYVFTSTWATTAGATTPLDECTCTDYAGDSGAPVNQCWNSSSHSDTSGMPAVWEKPFYVALENFYSQAVTHINGASYAPYVAYIRMGLSTGGEEFPHCSSNLETLVTPSTAAELETVWTGYANTMFTYEGGLGSQQPLMAAPNSNGTSMGVPSNAWADTEAADAVAQGLELGSEGLESSDTFVTNCTVSGASSNDWCYTFSHNNPPIRELQTLGYSDPLENTCTTNYFMAGNSDSQNTGSLVCVLPFVEGKANSVELYPEDVFLAFDSATTNYTTYGTAYATAISNLQRGH